MDQNPLVEPLTEGCWHTVNDFGDSLSNGGCYTGRHPGVDYNIRCATADDTFCDIGAPVFAIANGVVIYSREMIVENASIGRAVVIRHDLLEPIDIRQYLHPSGTLDAGVNPYRSKIYSAYLHMSGADSPQVGTVVALGGLIGHVGSQISRPHLHLELFAMDPVKDTAGVICYSTFEGLVDQLRLYPTAFIMDHLEPVPCRTAAGEISIMDPPDATASQSVRDAYDRDRVAQPGLYDPLVQEPVV